LLLRVAKWAIYRIITWLNHTGSRVAELPWEREDANVYSNTVVTTRKCTFGWQVAES